jgi:hypothetical protein
LPVQRPTKFELAINLNKPSPRYEDSFEVYGERKECPASPNYHVT